MSTSTVPTGTTLFATVASLCIGFSFMRWRRREWVAVPSPMDDLSPEGRAWLDEESYSALTAFVDTLFPRYSDEEVSTESIQQALSEMLGGKNAAVTAASVSGALDALLHRDSAEWLSQGPALLHHLRRGAIESKIPELIALAVGRYALKNDKTELYLALKAMSTTLGNLALTGFAMPFQHLSAQSRLKALRGLRDSGFLQKRAIFHALKRLCGFLFLAYTDPESKDQAKVNPSWGALRYEPNDAFSTASGSKRTAPQQANPLFSLPISDEGEVECDVVVIGSGAGGGMMAYQLSRAGYKVCVVEKGGNFTADEHFSKWKESDAMRCLYDRAGLLTSSDSNIITLAGSNVGGGTTVNWSASFRTPDHVLRDWEQQIPGDLFATGGEFSKALDLTHKLLNVNTDMSFTEGPCPMDIGGKDDGGFVVNVNNQLLNEGSKACGYNSEKIPRNVKNCRDCGNCMFGCASNSKQSTWAALMSKVIAGDASHTGGHQDRLLHILADCEVTRVLMTKNKGGRKKAVGVSAVHRIYDTEKSKGFDRVLLSERNVTIRSKAVVCSGGALHTPAILLRSGLTNSKIGRHLALHPVLGVAGLPPMSYLAEKGAGTTGLNRGVGMGVVVGRQPGQQASMGHEATRLSSDKSHHGVLIQTPPAHPGLMGLVLPWRSGLSSKLCALLFSQLAVFIGISRDRSSADNRITVDGQGQSVINYQVTAEDQSLLMAGLATQLRIMHASGCKVVFPLHETIPWFVRDDLQTPEQQHDTIEEYISKVMAMGYERLKMLCFSAHQMGSCRMAASPENGPVAPSGEVFETESLFVADASLFPTSLGVNPMLTVESFAIVVAQSVIKRLQEIDTLTAV